MFKCSIIRLFTPIILFLLISPPSYSQQTIDTGWKVQGKDVLKKDTTGKVVIGDMNAAETTEKLNVKGNIRLDGLRGNFDRDVYVDKDGILRTDKIERPIHSGGMPEDIMAKLQYFLDGKGDGTAGFGPNREECGFFLGDCKLGGNFGIGTKKPLKKLHVFTDHAPSGTSYLYDDPVYVGNREDELIAMPNSDDPDHNSHYGIRLQDRGVVKTFSDNVINPTVTSVINEEIWDFEPRANEKTFNLSTVNFSTGKRYFFMTFQYRGGTTDAYKHSYLYGDLDISQNLNVNTRLHVKGGYIRSRNNLFISGGNTSGDNNFIYSSNGILSFGKGPYSSANFNEIKIGIGTKSPLYNLDVTGDIHATGNTIIDGNVGIGVIPSQYKFDVKGDMHAVGKTIMEGNVEIGTNASPYKLDVYGDMHATGNVKFDGDLCLQYIKS